MEVVSTETRHIYCDGGNAELGHPKVYLEIKKGVDRIECPYCSKIFIYAPKEDKD